MKQITQAFTRFFAAESAGGIVLAIAALAALIVSNSSLADWYQGWLSLRGEVRVANDSLVLAKPLILWVNDLWMAIFFFLVGLEIKREFVEGELSGPGQLVLPAAAALGGMALPALIYAGINWGDANALRGWAIPAATDIAFALGIVMLLGSRVPLSLKVFLTAVAIIDDLGAIVVIAIFYTQNLSIPMLGGAVAAGLLLWLLNRRGIARADVYIVVGLIMWVFVLKSGVHATLAGDASAMLKYMGTELNKQRHELMMTAGGSAALEWDGDVGNRAGDWLRTKANSIEGGTSEVMLSIVSRRVLGLPA